MQCVRGGPGATLAPMGNMPMLQAGGMGMQQAMALMRTVGARAGMPGMGVPGLEMAQIDQSEEEDENITYC